MVSRPCYVCCVAWDVEYTDEFAQWWETLSVEQQERIDAVVGLLQERGPTLGPPIVDTLQGSALPNLKELRIRQDGTLRILFAFDPRRVAILLFGGDKTGEWQAWYRTAIPRAERLYQDHLDQLRKEGLLQ
jgi:hypothetical protein